MKKGSFVLGLGIGVIVMSVLFMLLGSGLRNSHERAMVAFAMENSRLEEQLDSMSYEYAPAAMSDQEVIEQATALGMTFAAEVDYGEPGGEYSAEEPYEEYPYEYPYEYSYEDVVVAQAPPVAAAPPVQPTPAPAPAPVQPTPAPTPVPAQPTPAPTPVPAPQAGVQVSIPSGTALRTISNILHDHGIVDDAYAFTAFVVENGAGTRLRHGDFTIEQGADFNEVLQRLLGN